MGQALGNFGSEATFLDLLRIAPFEEPEIFACEGEVTVVGYAAS